MKEHSCLPDENLLSGYLQTCVTAVLLHTVITLHISQSQEWKLVEGKPYWAITFLLCFFCVFCRRCNREFVLLLFAGQAKHSVHNLFQAISWLGGLETGGTPAQRNLSQPHHNFVTYAVLWQCMSCCIICLGRVWVGKANTISWCMHLFFSEWIAVFRNGFVSQCQ